MRKPLHASQREEAARHRQRLALAGRDVPRARHGRQRARGHRDLQSGPSKRGLPQPLACLTHSGMGGSMSQWEQPPLPPQLLPFADLAAKRFERRDGVCVDPFPHRPVRRGRPRPYPRSFFHLRAHLSYRAPGGKSRAKTTTYCGTSRKKHQYSALIRVSTPKNPAAKNGALFLAILGKVE